MSPAPDEGLRDLFAAVAAWTAQDGDTDYNREWMARAYAAVTAGGAVDPLAHPAPPPEPAPSEDTLRGLVLKRRQIMADMRDFDGDLRGHLGALHETDEAIIRHVERVVDAALKREGEQGHE